MYRLLLEYYEDNISEPCINEKFNYEFNILSTKEQFEIEYQKFLGIYRMCFFYIDRLVTVINSCEIRLNKKDLEHIIKMYIYANNNKFKKEENVLVEFLYTYYTSINSNSYKANYLEYEEVKNEFMELLEKSKIRKEFFTSFCDIIYDLYNQVLKFAFEKDIYINDEIINRIFNNLRFKSSYCKNLINLFIENKRNLPNIIEFDKEKSEHIDTYMEYIINSLNNLYIHDDSNKMLLELDKEKCLQEEQKKLIINKYVDIVNKICDNLKDKQYSFIRGISEIENIKNELNYILRNIKNFNVLQKDKVRECIIKLLELKRFLISDDEYVKREMEEISFEQIFNKKELKIFVQSLLENELKVYSASKMNFTKQIENALYFYSKYPIQSEVSNYSIDSEKQIYLTSENKKNNTENNNFKKYFDKKGEEYTKEHSKSLKNRLSKDYYEEFLKYLSKNFEWKQEIIVFLLGEKNFYYIINKLKIRLNYDYDNNYAIVVNNILAIETNIIKILQKKNRAISSNGFENINILLKEFKNNEKVINGLMYLNYTLYEKSGLNLRNSIMHGTLINSKLEVPLLVTFSGLIFVSWLLNE